MESFCNTQFSELMEKITLQTGNRLLVSGSRSEAKKKWGELTDDELIQIAGARDILAGKIQEKYGIAKEDVNKQIDEWAAKLKV